jgi:endogenous inhibitor of DNA gyrase (YacG/DUF329 family)
MPAQSVGVGSQKPAKPAKCPICGGPSVDRYKPFCSRRCADVDLARWLSGAYAIPDKVESEDGGEGSDPSPPSADAERKGRA